MRERIREMYERVAQYTPKRENIAATVLILCLCLSGVAAGQLSQERTWTDDFNDGNADGWENDADGWPKVVTENGNQSLYQETLSGAPRSTWVQGPALDLSEEFTINGTIKPRHDGDTFPIRLGVFGPNESVNSDDNALLIFDHPNTATYLSSDPTPDSVPSDVIGTGFNGEWVNFEIHSPADNATLQAKVWRAGNAEPSTYQLTESFTPRTGSFVVAPGSDTSQTRHVYLDNVAIRGQETISANLTLKHNNYMSYGETQPYSVTFQTGNFSRTEVTAESTVTSLNRSVVTFSNTTNTMTATEDESVSARVQTRAVYNGSVDYSYVVVAKPVVENLEILPPIYRFSATIGDDSIFFLIIAMLTAVVATRFTTAFGGICVYELVVLMGWFSGWLSFGVMLLITMTAIFIGLNLAANINYGAVGNAPGMNRLQ